MEFPKDWDLDKYKSEYESEEHWELRKKFMETHKNKFPEDKLVCLARVFFNIEFLGCRYPDKTMKLIAELSAGVADDYREKKKGKLKRTFVQASDAAEAKIKRTGSTSTSTTQEPPHKLLKTSFHPSTNHWNSCSVHESVMKHQDKGEFPGFVIYESVNCKCPISLLSMSVHKSKMWKSINFDFPESKNSPTNPERFCEVSIDGKVLASGVGIGNKEAKKNAAINGLKKLRETCYTIQEKVPFSSGGDHVSKDTVVSENKTPETLPMDNIGSKMMLRMGWTGSGLGKNQQGIKTPIQATNTMRRAGFGHMNNTEFRKKFKVVLMDYMESDTGNDLVFAPDFSKEERKILHELAQRLKLKTKSHGENEQRQLVVFKILTPPEIVEMLLRCGGENDKYLLVPPHTEESKSPSNEQASANQTEGDRENNVSVQPVASHSTNDNSTSPISSLSVQVNDQQKVCEIESKDASVCDSDCEDDSNSDSDATYTEDIVNESDIDVIDRVMNNKLAAVNDSVKLYNHLIQQQYQGKKFTKKERKKYFKHKKFLLNRGIVLKDVTSVKYFKLEDYLVDVNSINVVTASNLPKSCPNKKHHKKILKANSVWHSEITGLQVLRAKPELISKDIREVIQQLKMEEAKKLKIYKLGKNLRRKIKLFVRTIGAKTLYN